MHFESLFKHQIGGHLEQIVCILVLINSSFVRPQAPKMESAEVPPSSQQEIPSKPEAGQENSEPTTALSSMAAANQPDNETVAMIKTPQSLEGDQSVDGKGEVPMDTSLTKEETESKKELVADQENTTPPDMQEGE